MTAGPPSGSAVRRMLDESGLLAGGPQRRFALVSLIDSLGTGLFLPLLVLFFTRSAGLGAGQVALGLSLAGLCALAATPAGGHLLDRHDPRLTLGLSYAVRAGVYAAYPLVRSLALFVPLVCLAQSAAQVGRSARTMVAAGMTSEGERVRLLAGVAAIRNLGVGLGSLGAGAVLAVDTRAAYLVVVWIDAASYAAAGLLVRTLPPVDRARPPARPDGGGRAGERGTVRAVLRDRRYASLAGLNAVLLVSDAALTVGVPIWLTTATAAPAVLTGPLFALNTAMVVALQVALSRSSETLDGAGRAYLRGGVAFLVGCAFFALAGSGGRVAAIAFMVAGVGALTVAEISSAAAGWGVSLGLAPADRRGRYLATFSLGEGVASTAGPALVTFAVVQGAGTGWLALGAAVAVAGALARRLCRRPADRVPEPSLS